MQRNRYWMVGLGVVLLFTSGCATIVGGGSTQVMAITSTPTNASFTVKGDGRTLSSGQTPGQVRLERKRTYEIEFTAPGFQPKTFSLMRGTNGWVFGNLIFGWILGFAIDFITGSAYKLEPATVEVSLTQVMARDGTTQTEAVVVLKDSHGKVVGEQREMLVPIR